LSGISKPTGVRSRVSEGKGRGWDFCTLEKPVPLAGVKGFCKSKNIFIYHKYLPKKVHFFFQKKVFLDSMKAYYTKSDHC